MTEPVTSSKTLIVPNTGDLAGTWGTAALNPNFSIIDAMFGGVTTISLSSTTTILLSVPATTGIWGGSVPQSSNSLIVFTGAQTGSAVIQFSLPGFYIVHNKCTGTTFVQLSPATGTGNKVGAPPGRKAHVFFDGTDMDYVDMQEVGSALDLHGVSTTPPWMTACTVRPYLMKDGSIHTSSIYPQLAQLLGSTFGGNGITTFAVPDERSRVRVGLDPAGSAARLTTTYAGFSGATMGAAGGNEAPQAHSHAASVTDPGHDHNVSGGTLGGSGSFSAGSGPNTVPGGSTTIDVAVGVTGITVTNTTAGVGGSGNVQPTIVSHLPLIKT